MKIIKKIVSIFSKEKGKNSKPEKVERKRNSAATKKGDAQNKQRGNQSRQKNSPRTNKDGERQSEKRTSGRRQSPSKDTPRGKFSERRGKSGRHPRERNFESRAKDSSPIKTSLLEEIPAALPLDELVLKLPEFAELGLNAKILNAIFDMGYVSPTPIQSTAIPAVLSGRDLIGTAQTGTGKTAAFALPVAQMLDVPHSQPRVLVLSPTRELASQIAEAFKNFSKYCGIKTLLIQGGVAIGPQVDAIEAGVDVLVATPGRLLDHIRQKTLSLQTVKYLILDEVDRMFDMGFIEDVSNIIRYCPKEKQTLFFSATMPDEVLRLSNWALADPVRLDTGIVHSPADTIEHFIYPVDGIQKYDLLTALLGEINTQKAIVFTRTRMDADRVGEWLSAHGHKVATLHSDRSQKERERALQDFKEGKAALLVATDIASRGLDISDVAYVINFNVPEHQEDYVHRIGRTGRANKEGMAFTLYSSEETMALQRIEAFIRTPIERRKLDSFNYRHEPILSVEQKQKRKRNR